MWNCNAEIILYMPGALCRRYRLAKRDVYFLHMFFLFSFNQHAVWLLRDHRMEFKKKYFVQDVHNCIYREKKNIIDIHSIREQCKHHRSAARHYRGIQRSRGREEISFHRTVCFHTSNFTVASLSNPPAEEKKRKPINDKCVEGRKLFSSTKTHRHSCCVYDFSPLTSVAIG